MRYLFVLLIGLVIGCLAALSIRNALQQRDPVPRAVMVLLQYHLGSASNALRQPGCSSGKVEAELNALAHDAGTIEPVFVGFDAGFTQARQHLQQAISTAQASHPASCVGWQAPLAAIKDACAACHRQYR